MSRAAAIMAALLLLAGCSASGDDSGRPESALEFPKADRPVSALGSNQFSSEIERDSVNEAQTVMDLAEIRSSMTVADIGAGEGYYTTRLAERVGSKGRVLAQDIDPEALNRLGLRVERERLDNVSIKLGAEDDPKLPENSFDRVLLFHMYQEVTEPYAFLWRLRPALREHGQVVVVGIEETSTPTCACSTTSGMKPVPVTARLPVTSGMPQVTTFAETREPPIAMKWTT